MPEAMRNHPVDDHGRLVADPENADTERVVLDATQVPTERIVFNPAQANTERTALDRSQAPTERIVDPTQAETQRMTAPVAHEAPAVPSSAETQPRIKGGWSETGESLRDADRAAAERGSEQLLGKKIALDAEVQKESSLFKETLSSWWNKTKNAFKGAKSWVTNEKAIAAMNAKMDALKTGYEAKAEQAVTPNAQANVAESIDVHEKNGLVVDLRALQAQYDTLAEEVAREGAGEAYMQKKVLKGQISPDVLAISKAGAKLNETLAAINVLKARIARGETTVNPASARAQRIAEMGTRVDQAMAAEDAQNLAIENAIEASLDQAEAEAAVKEPTLDERVASNLSEQEQAAADRRAEFESAIQPLADDLAVARAARHKRENTKAGVTVRKPGDKSGKVIDLMHPQKTPDAPAAEEEVIELTDIKKPTGVVSGELAAKPAPASSESKPAADAEPAWQKMTREAQENLRGLRAAKTSDELKAFAAQHGYEPKNTAKMTDAQLEAMRAKLEDTFAEAGGIVLMPPGWTEPVRRATPPPPPSSVTARMESPAAAASNPPKESETAKLRTPKGAAVAEQSPAPPTTPDEVVVQPPEAATSAPEAPQVAQQPVNNNETLAKSEDVVEKTEVVKVEAASKEKTPYDKALSAADVYALKLTLQGGVVFPNTIKKIGKMPPMEFVAFLVTEKILKKNEANDLKASESEAGGLRDAFVSRLRDIRESSKKKAA